MAAATIVYDDPTAGGSGKKLEASQAGFNHYSGTAAWPDSTTSCFIMLKPGASQLILSEVCLAGPATGAYVTAASAERLYAPVCGAIIANKVTITRDGGATATGATLFNFEFGSR